VYDGSKRSFWLIRIATTLGHSIGALIALSQITLRLSLSRGWTLITLRDVTDKVYQVGRALQAKTGAHEVVLTRGKEGMTIFIKDQIVEVPTYARKGF
jgi:hypothetical protein